MIYWLIYRRTIKAKTLKIKCRRVLPILKISNSLPEYLSFCSMDRRDWFRGEVAKTFDSSDWELLIAKTIFYIINI